MAIHELIESRSSRFRPHLSFCSRSGCKAPQVERGRISLVRASDSSFLLSWRFANRMTDRQVPKSDVLQWPYSDLHGGSVENSLMMRLTSRFLIGLALVALLMNVSTVASVAAPSAQEEGQEYVVQPGDSLYGISQKVLANGSLWPLIQDATNARTAEDDSYARIDNPRLLFVGQKVWIPAESMPMAGAEEEMAADQMADADEKTEDEVDAAEPQMAEVGDEMQATLTSAVDQIAVAVAHVDLLQGSLDAGNLADAQKHAEHVINILDGEDGRTYGDSNRDGTVQNPGDGIGVRVYLADTLPDAQQLVQKAIDGAEQIFAVDTADEAMGIAGSLNEVLIQLQTTSSDALVESGEMGSPDGGGEMDAGMAESPLAAVFTADEDGILAAAQKQAELALSHFGFFLDELATEDLDAANHHAEHIINILDGEGGPL